MTGQDVYDVNSIHYVVYHSVSESTSSVNLSRKNTHFKELGANTFVIRFTSCIAMF